MQDANTTTTTTSKKKKNARRILFFAAHLFVPLALIQNVPGFFAPNRVLFRQSCHFFSFFFVTLLSLFDSENLKNTRARLIDALHIKVYFVYNYTGGCWAKNKSRKRSLSVFSLSPSASLSLTAIYSYYINFYIYILIVSHQVVGFQNALFHSRHATLSSRPGILMQNPFRDRLVDRFRRFADQLLQLRDVFFRRGR